MSSARMGEGEILVSVCNCIALSHMDLIFFVSNCDRTDRTDKKFREKVLVKHSGKGVSTSFRSRSYECVLISMTSPRIGGALVGCNRFLRRDWVKKDKS